MNSTSLLYLLRDFNMSPSNNEFVSESYSEFTKLKILINEAINNNMNLIIIGD